MWRLVPVITAAAILTACGGTAPAPPAAPASPAASKPAPQAAAPQLKHVTLQTSWLMSGYNAPYVLAQEKGYYRDAGFDVKVVEGKGSAPTVTTMGKGDVLFGEGDDSQFAPFISKGAPVTVIATYVQKVPFSFVTHKGTRLDTPRDLIGHTIISNEADGDYQYLPLVLSKAGMTMKDLKLQLVQPNLYVPTFLKDRGAILLGFANDTYVRVLKEEPTAQDKLFADFGVTLYNAGLITSTDEIQQHPDEVKRFLAATNRGWQEAIAHPDEAADAAVKEFPNADRGIMLEQLQRSLPLLHTAATDGHPLGWMAASDWETSLQLLHQYGGMETVKPTADYYTNGFLPQS